MTLPFERSEAIQDAKLPKGGRYFPQKYSFWVMTPAAKSPTLEENRVCSDYAITNEDVPLYTLFPLSPFKLLRSIQREYRSRRNKSKMLVWRTRKNGGDYPFHVRCGGGCRFHPGPAVCYPFKRLCWERVDRRYAFANPVQLALCSLDDALTPPW